MDKTQVWLYANYGPIGIRLYNSRLAKGELSEDQQTIINKYLIKGGLPDN